MELLSQQQQPKTNNGGLSTKKKRKFDVVVDARHAELTVQQSIKQ